MKQIGESEPITISTCQPNASTLAYIFLQNDILKDKNKRNRGRAGHIIRKQPREVLLHGSKNYVHVVVVVKQSTLTFRSLNFTKDKCSLFC